MIWELLFWLGMLGALVPGWVYFRDLGDVVQMIIKVRRENTLRAIRRERQLLTVGLTALGVMALAHLGFGAAPASVFWPAFVVLGVLYAFPYVWVHLGLRNQQHDASFYPLHEAALRVSPQASVLVLEHEGVARAYPDYELMRPHLAGNAEGLAGESVVMTYCAMAISAV